MIEPGDKVLVKSIGRIATVDRCNCTDTPLMGSLLVYEDDPRSFTGFRYWHVSEEGVVLIPDNATLSQIDAIRSILK